jgi:hypothetical protein
MTGGNRLESSALQAAPSLRLRYGALRAAQLFLIGKPRDDFARFLAGYQGDDLERHSEAVSLKRSIAMNSIDQPLRRNT